MKTIDQKRQIQKIVNYSDMHLLNKCNQFLKQSRGKSNAMSIKKLRLQKWNETQLLKLHIKVNGDLTIFFLPTLQLSANINMENTPPPTHKKKE